MGGSRVISVVSAVVAMVLMCFNVDLVDVHHV